MKTSVRHRLLPRVAKAHIVRAATAVCETLRSAGHEAFFVGGAVRDLLLAPQVVPFDIDICTDASPERVSVLLPGGGFVGKAFGVSLVKRGGFSFECATFRCEGAYTDRRHPDSVRPGTQEEDSRRRDFTVNALYFDPVGGMLVDFHGGIGDIKAERLACVGSARERLFEDPLRIVRLFRFAVATGFSIDPCTLTSAREPDVKGGLRLLSKERVLAEITKVKPGRAAPFFERLLGAIEPGAFFASLRPNCEVGLEGASGLANAAANPAWNAAPLATLHCLFPATVFGVFLCAAGFAESDSFFALAEWPLQGNDRELLRACLHLAAGGPADEGIALARAQAARTGDAGITASLEAFLFWRLTRPLRFVPYPVFEALCAAAGADVSLAGGSAIPLAQLPSRSDLAAFHTAEAFPLPWLGVLLGLHEAISLADKGVLPAAGCASRFAGFSLDAPDWRTRWREAAAVCLFVARASLVGLQLSSHAQR